MIPKGKFMQLFNSYIIQIEEDYIIHLCEALFSLKVLFSDAFNDIGIT